MVRVASSYPGAVTIVPSGRTNGARVTRSSGENFSARLNTAAIEFTSGQVKS